MNKELVLNEIKGYAKLVPHFLPKDIDNICEFSSQILDIDFLNVAPCIDKRKIAKILFSIFDEINIDFRKGLFPDTVIPESILLLERIWEYISKKRVDLFFENLDRTTYRGIYHTIREILVNKVMEGAEKKLANTMPKEELLRLLPTLRAYFSDGIRNIILLNFKRVNFTSNNKKIYSPAFKKIIHLMEDGYGILFWVGSITGKRIEVRLPIWAQKDYPVIIDYEPAKWLEVSIIKEYTFVPEKVWRYPDKLGVHDILNEPNVEVRRIMMDILSNEKLLNLPNVKLLDEYNDLKLYRVPFGHIDLHLIRCICPSTNREYYLKVPPTIRNAQEAIAWTFRETKDSYRPIIET